MIRFGFFKDVSFENSTFFPISPMFNRSIYPSVCAGSLLRLKCLHILSLAVFENLIVWKRVPRSASFASVSDLLLHLGIIWILHFKAVENSSSIWLACHGLVAFCLLSAQNTDALSVCRNTFFFPGGPFFYFPTESNYETFQLSDVAFRVFV